MTIKKTLKEWSKETLEGYDFSTLQILSEQDLDTVTKLSNGNILKIIELKNKIEIESFSYVGIVTVGDLEITILPKINNFPFFNLLSYAYKIKKVKIFADAKMNVGENGFQELLFMKLAFEVERLIHHGIVKTYIEKKENLQTIMGKVDFKKYALESFRHTSNIPCIYYRRNENTLLNQIVLTGCKLAEIRSANVEVINSLNSSISYLEKYAETVSLSQQLFRRAFSLMSRMNNHYLGLLNIIYLLYNSYGVVYDNDVPVSFNGFLLNMNHFFQTLLTRFLSEYQREFSVKQEYRLQQLIVIENNQKHIPPKIPRPDIALEKKGNPLFFIDAKYIDLWENQLPAYIIYQMAIYGLASKNQRSMVIYPTVSTAARDMKIRIQNPFTLQSEMEIIIRPLHILELSKMIDENDEKGLQKLAEEMVQVV